MQSFIQPSFFSSEKKAIDYDPVFITSDYFQLGDLNSEQNATMCIKKRTNFMEIVGRIVWSVYTGNCVRSPIAG